MLLGYFQRAGDGERPVIPPSSYYPFVPSCLKISRAGGLLTLQALKG